MSEQCSKIGTIPIMTLQCRKLLGVLFFLLVFHSLCDAAFRVYLKDGASKQVSRIYFNGPKVDLYEISGVKVTVSRADIDYERSGFKEPEAAVGVSIYGTHEAPNEEASRRPAYEDLESLWNSAKQKAVASKDFGTITKGQEVRVIGSDAISYTIIAREQDGGYTRRVVDSETFFDFFESSLEKKRPVKNLPPVNVKPVETRFPEAPPPEKPKPILDASLYKPLGAGFIYLLLLSIAIPLMNRLKERFYELRFGIVLIFLAALTISAKIAYDKGVGFYWQDRAKNRVDLVLEGISDGGRIE
ncbi:MAG TPA: hypothetical protein VJ521_12300, partial [Acidobacteriota bacterium]|nr:hypothetical protein [Acidobacteriota bacterium]